MTKVAEPADGTAPPPCGTLTDVSAIHDQLLADVRAAAENRDQAVARFEAAVRTAAEARVHRDRLAEAAGYTSRDGLARLLRRLRTDPA